MKTETKKERLNIVENLDDLLKAVGVDSKESLKRVIFKYTDCGAWVATDELKQVSVGSIVEGVDWGTSIHSLEYPFKADEFWTALGEVEKEASRIWDETHGCEDCGEEDPESGYTPVNPDCKTCEGYGIVI